MRKLVRYHVHAAAVALALFLLAIANNNIRTGRQTAAEFNSRLDMSLRNSIEWEAALDVEPNPYLLYMVRETAALSGDARLRALLERSSRPVRATYLARLVEPNAPFIAPPPVVNTLAPYERWIIHAISRGEYILAESDRAEMYEPNKSRTGRATHQLYSLMLQREFNGATDTLDSVIRQLSLRIAKEAAVDFRVTDLYLQRIAFLLAAGQADLVNPRWVERALAAQEASGGWYFNWYGWGPTPYVFSPEDFPNNHATAQGMWLSCLLKYKYPEWVKAHYSR
ncbi:MAG: hypothetical protein JNM66_12445 [Bryobacterales bacterium]|nr:hypothetical protein [Bryobacterales bacterium]